MKNITINNYKGKEFSGDWNEKVYSSKIDGQPELLRIYINDQQLHVESEVLNAFTNNLKNLELNNMKDLIKSKDAELKAELLEMLLNDEDTKNAFAKKSGLNKVNMIKATRMFFKREE